MLRIQKERVSKALLWLVDKVLSKERLSQTDARIPAKAVKKERLLSYKENEYSRHQDIR